MAPAALVGLGALGAGWGVFADRLSSRWPAHEDGSRRTIGWRTGVTIVVAALALPGLAAFAEQPAALAFVGLYVLALVVLLATDLDQRLLPDVITLPLIPYALVGAAFRIGPYAGFGPGFVLDVVAALGLPALLFALSIPFGRGAIGIGDLKLLVSVGFVAGAERAVIGLIFGAILSAVVILALIAARRIGLRSYVPYGPFLIVGVLWALLGPVGGAR